MSYAFPQARLIVFAKAPIAGQCKSRLAASIGDEAAAEVQAMLIRRCLDAVCRQPLCPTELWCAPASTHALFQAMAMEYSLTLYEQQGRDLGQRMYKAMSRQQAQATIIIGTDCPDMSQSYIRSALLALQGEHDAVIGPAEDGGYVLLGLKQIDPRLFAQIDWGTDKVYQQTREKCERLGWHWHALETLWDIDLQADWLRFTRLKSITYK